MPNRGSQRIEWIDNLKLVAGILMLVDHSAVFLGGIPDWVRVYATRCVEPLYAFVFFYLLAQRCSPMGSARYVVLATAAAAECIILSRHYGTLTLGILASLVVTAPIFEAVREKGIGIRLAIVSVAGFLSAFPFGVRDVIVIDYGVPLLLGQGLIAASVAVLRTGMIRLFLFQFAGLLIGICVVRIGELDLSPSCLTVLVGQPVAVTLILVLRGIHLGRPIGLAARIIVGHPLIFYIGHLALLAAVARAYPILVEIMSTVTWEIGPAS
jgi:hypothetical protein